MGERSKDEVNEIITIAEAAACAIHQRPGHILVYLAGDSKKDSQDQDVFNRCQCLEKAYGIPSPDTQTRASLSDPIKAKIHLSRFFSENGRSIDGKSPHLL